MTHLPARPAVGLAGAVATVAVLLTGCGHSATSAATPSAPHASASSPAGSGGTRASRPVITIKDFAFTGPPSVAPGATVTVTNQDAEAHTLSADGPGGFDIKVDPGRSVRFTAPTAPGSYGYHCAFHSNMHGTLKVG